MGSQALLVEQFPELGIDVPACGGKVCGSPYLESPYLVGARRSPAPQAVSVSIFERQMPGVAQDQLEIYGGRGPASLRHLPFCRGPRRAMSSFIRPAPTAIGLSFPSARPAKLPLARPCVGFRLGMKEQGDSHLPSLLPPFAPACRCACRVSAEGPCGRAMERCRREYRKGQLVGISRGLHKGHISQRVRK